MPIPLSGLILAAPALGALALMVVPNRRHAFVRRIAVATTSVSLAGAIGAMVTYHRASGGYQHELAVPWIRSLGIGLHLGMDGISVVLVLLHALCAFTGVLISYAIK